MCCLALAATGCGDDDGESGGAGGGTGATNGTAGTGGTGGSSGAGEACGVICRSPCVEDLMLLPSEVERCVALCEEDAVIVTCDSEISAFLGCYEQINCMPTGTECLDEALEVFDCLNVP